MKPKQQKRVEALGRLQAHIKRLEQSITEAKRKSKEWKPPVLTAKSTLSERAVFALLPKENPFLKVIELEERHLSRLEKEQQVLKNAIANNRTAYP